MTAAILSSSPDADGIPADSTMPAPPCVTGQPEPTQGVSDRLHPITAEHVRRVLSYDPETGLFTWRVRAGTRRFAGSRAGRVDCVGYVVITVARKNYKAHRLAWLHVYGRWPDGALDHINGVRTDNHIANLRECSTSENGQNSKPLYSSNTSGYKGVSLLAGKWRACIQRNGKKYHFGLFDTPEAAAQAVEAARKSFQPFAADREVTVDQRSDAINRATFLMQGAFLRWKESGLMLDRAKYEQAQQAWERVVSRWGGK